MPIAWRALIAAVAAQLTISARLRATISITGRTSRLDEERVEELVPDLLRVTAEVSRLLGHG